MEYKLPNFDSYDQDIADTMLDAASMLGGLPDFLGAKLVEYGPGTLTATLEVRPDHITPLGTLHGGVMAGFVDHILGGVLYPLMPRGQWAATTEFKLNYLAPVTGGTLHAESRVLSLGKRSAVVRVEVVCGDRLVCSAQGTLLISRPPSPGAG